MSGKTTFKSIFTKGSKSEQIKMLEKTMADDEKEIEYMGVLVDYISVILGAIEIPKFKVEPYFISALQATPILRNHQQIGQDGAEAPAHLRSRAEGSLDCQPEHQV